MLFIHGEPISYKKVEAVLKLDREACETVIAELEERLEDGARGLQLVVGNDKIQLATKPDFNDILEEFVKEELSEDLTPASRKPFQSLHISAHFPREDRAFAGSELDRYSSDSHDPRFG